MFGLFSPVRLRQTTAVLVLVTPLALAGCTTEDGPTVTQASHTLKNHILQLLKERNAQNIVITDPGGKNIPCADGKAKQTFAATAVDIDTQTNPQIIKDGLISTLTRIAPYKIISDGFDNKPIHVENLSSYTDLFLNSPANGRIEVQGQTQCLLAP